MKKFYLSLLFCLIMASSCLAQEEQPNYTLNSVNVFYSPPGNNSMGSDEGISISNTYYKGKWGPRIGLSLYFFEDHSLNVLSNYEGNPLIAGKKIKSFEQGGKDFCLDLDFGISRLDRNIGNSKISLVSFASTGISIISLSSKALFFETASETEYFVNFYGEDLALIPIKVGSSVMYNLSKSVNLSLGVQYNFAFGKMNWEYGSFSNWPFDFESENSSSRMTINKLFITAGVNLLYPRKK